MGACVKVFLTRAYSHVQPLGDKEKNIHHQDTKDTKLHQVISFIMALQRQMRDHLLVVLGTFVSLWLIFPWRSGYLPFDQLDIQPDQRRQFLIAIYFLEGPEGQADAIDRAYPIDLHPVALGIGEGLL